MFLNSKSTNSKSDTMPETKQEKKYLKIKTTTVWQLLTLIFAASFFAAIFGKIPAINSGISSQEAGNKVIHYINKNLIQSGSCSLVSVQDVGGLYKVTTSYQGQNIPVYVSKDGKLLFVSSPIDTTASSQSTTTTTEINKTARPTVEMYVMSFCPYGIQAETAMKPAFDLLSSSVDFKVRFITVVSGNTIDSIQSLHGTNEASEDLRQVCIMKNYDAKTYWNYMQSFDSNCPSFLNNATALDNCWKSAATKFGIDTSLIQSCASGNEGLQLVKADADLATQLGIQGSPTILINGAQYGGDRSSDSFKQAICSAFTNPPAACSQNLNSTTVAASGGCG